MSDNMKELKVIGEWKATCCNFEKFV